MAAKAEQSLRKTLTTLSSASPTSEKTTSLLTSAKRDLLTLNALIPSPSTPPAHLSLARSVLETGALLSIRAQNPDAFTRYYQQLQAFYDLSPSAYGKGGDGEGQRGKVTGLYLLLLLTKGDYAGFHTVLEGLETQGRGVGVDGIGGTAKTGKDADRFVRYPVMLEQWLMEGAYDRVWAATKREGVPSEEFGVFHEVRIKLHLGFERWRQLLMCG